MEPTPEQLDHMHYAYDEIVAKLDSEQVRELFDDLNEEADKHPPRTRQLYLALYRRLHG